MQIKLDEAQRQKVTAWIGEGLKLAEIQKRLEEEFKVRLTYLDTRLLVDDLKLTPKDPEPPKVVAPEPAAAAAAGPAAAVPGGLPGAGGGNVAVSVDQVTRPGALVSGKVTFSDGQTATWHLDEAGRLGLVPAVQGYKPTPEDVQAFQRALQAEMQKLGY